MSGRGLTIALVASAALNVFIIGAVAGLWVTHGFPDGGPPPLHAAADRLNPTDRAALQQVMHDQMEANGPVLLDARKARREARQLMLAQPFDPAATAAALARARADDQQIRAQFETAVVNFAATLSPQERAVLSTGLMRGNGPRGLFHHGMGGDHHHPPPSDAPPPPP
jgi:uncharacterized membrane protein